MPAQSRAPKGSGTAAVHNGRWTVQVDFGVVNGKRLRKKFSGSSEDEARGRAAAWKADHEDGLEPDVIRNLTVAQLLTRWLQHLELTMKPARPRTYLSYQQQSEQHISPALGAIRVRLLNPADVERMVAKGLSEGLSIRSATYQRAVLRIALNWAMKQGWAVRNAAALADVPPVIPAARRALTVDEARRVMQRPHVFQLLWIVALTTGLRVGELCGLQWGDVDWQAGTLSVRRQVQRIEGELMDRPTVKTPGSKATILLPNITLRALAKQYKHDPADRWIFQSKARGVWEANGRPLEPRNVSRSWHTLLKRLGIPDVKLHATRYTCGSLLYDAGVPDKIIQSVLRHAKLGTTMDIYVNPGPVLQRSAAAAMDQLFGADDAR